MCQIHPLGAGRQIEQNTFLRLQKLMKGLNDTANIKKARMGKIKEYWNGFK